MEQYRSLTEEETKRLSLELRVCYFLFPWNICAKIDSVDKWVETFHCFYDDDDKDDAAWRERAKVQMRKEFDNLCKFTCELLQEKYDR